MCVLDIQCTPSVSDNRISPIIFNKRWPARALLKYVPISMESTSLLKFVYSQTARVALVTSNLIIITIEKNGTLSFSPYNPIKAQNTQLTRAEIEFPPISLLPPPPSSFIIIDFSRAHFENAPRSSSTLKLTHRHTERVVKSSLTQLRQSEGISRALARMAFIFSFASDSKLSFVNCDESERERERVTVSRATAPR